MSRLDILDAAFHYASKSTSRDQYVLLTFDTGDLPSPTFDEITEFIGVRARSIPDLNKRLVEIPGNLDYPYWSRSGEPPRILQFDSRTWEGVVDELGLLVQTPVDATRAAWQVHVARDVEDVPHASGRALVVVFQVSHALTDGRGATRLARALFSVEPP
ncbi:MAG: wax ester/triacylglycerol synthase domain-containing protein, partial [Rhodococcus fascians]